MTRTRQVTGTALTALCLMAAASTPALAGPFGGGRGPGAGFPIEKMAKRLDLSDEQVASLRALQDANMRATIEVDGEIAYAEYELRTLMQSEQPDRAAIFDKVDQLAALHADKRKLRLGALLDGRALLTEEQRDKAGRLLMERPGRRGHIDGRHGKRQQRGRPADDRFDGSDEGAPQ